LNDALKKRKEEGRRKREGERGEGEGREGGEN